MQRLFLLLAFIATMSGATMAQTNKTQVGGKSAYLIGYATSFKDSVIYLSTAQLMRLPNLKSDTEARTPYTTQWTSYLKARADVQYPICVLFQESSEKEADKLLAQLKRKAYKAGFKRIVEVQPSEFSFLETTTTNTPNP